MALTGFLALFPAAASAAVFLVARKRVRLGAAIGLSGLTFLMIAGVFIVLLQVALSGMNG